MGLENSSKIFLLFFFIGLWFLTLQNFGINGEYLMAENSYTIDAPSTDVLKWAEEAENSGDYDQAIEYYSQLAQFYETNLGSEHPDVITLSQNLYRTYFNSQKYDKAFPLAWKIYKLQEKTRGKEHPDTLVMLAELGKNYIIRGNFGKAEELLKRAYRLTKVQLGGNHEKTIEILLHLGHVYRASLKNSNSNKNVDVDLNSDLALRYYSKVYDVRSNDPEIGPEQEESLQALKNIGDVLAIKNKMAEAVETYQKVLEIRTRRLGENHPLTQEVKQVLIVTLSQTGKSRDAIKLLDKEDPAKHVDDDDDALVAIVEGKAIALANKGKWAKALEILSELYDHESLKRHLSPKILSVLDKLITFSKEKKDLDLTLKWANVMIDLAKNQNQNQKVKVATKEDGGNMILVHLHALQSAIYVNVQKNEEKRVDEYFMKAVEVIKGQGQERSTAIFEKYWTIMGIVADFKAQIGKMEDAAILYEYMVQNCHGDEASLTVVTFMVQFAIKKDNYEILSKVAQKFLKNVEQTEEKKRRIRKEPKEKNQHLDEQKIQEIVAQLLFQKASEYFELKNYEDGLSLLKTLEMIWPKSWNQDDPNSSLMLQKVAASASQLSKMGESFLILKKLVDRIKIKMNTEPNSWATTGEEERMEVIKAVEMVKELQETVKKTLGAHNFQNFQDKVQVVGEGESESDSESLGIDETKERDEL